MYFGRNTLLYQDGEKPERRQGDSWEAKAEGLPRVEGGRGSGRAGLCRGGPATGFRAPQVWDGAGSWRCRPQLCDTDNLPAPTRQCPCPGCEKKRQALSSEGHMTREDFRPDKGPVLLSLECLLLSPQRALCWGWGRRSRLTLKLAAPQAVGSPSPRPSPANTTSQAPAMALWGPDHYYTHFTES